MAERRMFAKAIVGSTRFLRMPPSARLLYYDLGMQADDDGFVETFSTLLATGATEDDLRLLAECGFITILNEDMVSHITDWTRNNLIRKDRYSPSIYHNLLAQVEEKTAKGSGKPMVNQRLTQVRLGEDRLGKGRVGEDRGPVNRPTPPAPAGAPPTKEAVSEFIRANGLNVDADRFFQYYEDRRWVTQNGKSINWQDRAKKWSKSERGGKARASAPAKTPEQEAAENRAYMDTMRRLLEQAEEG